jgi:hypothetical protein
MRISAVVHVERGGALVRGRRSTRQRQWRGRRTTPRCGGARGGGEGGGLS